MRSASCLFLVFTAVVVAGCSPGPRPAALSEDAALNAFAREVERSLEAHDWQAILSIADPDHYRIQVAEGGMGEPQYVAELFGLHHVDNNIRQGDVVTWSDLERIETLSLESIEQAGDRYRLGGSLRLGDGTVLALHAQIVERNGRYYLTGAVG